MKTIKAKPNHIFVWTKKANRIDSDKIKGDPVWEAWQHEIHEQYINCGIVKQKKINKMEGVYV